MQTSSNELVLVPNELIQLYFAYLKNQEQSGGSPGNHNEIQMLFSKYFPENVISTHTDDDVDETSSVTSEEIPFEPSAAQEEEQEENL